MRKIFTDIFRFHEQPSMILKLHSTGLTIVDRANSAWVSWQILKHHVLVCKDYWTCQIFVWSTRCAVTELDRNSMPAMQLVSRSHYSCRVGTHGVGYYYCPLVCGQWRCARIIRRKWLFSKSDPHCSRYSNPKLAWKVITFVACWEYLTQMEAEIESEMDKLEKVTAETNPLLQLLTTQLSVMDVVEQVNGAKHS